MKTTLLIAILVALAPVLSSCVGAVYTRSIVTQTRNHAEPYALINNHPYERDDSVAAEKTVDFETKSNVAASNANASVGRNDASKSGGQEASSQGGSQGGLEAPAQGAEALPAEDDVKEGKER